ncbi:MAG: rhodanese-like domain-containing protein [Planctomycetota bacterium]
MSEPLPLEIDVRSVKALQDNHTEFLLLDVRQPEEFAAAKIEGSVLIPMGELGERLTELGDDHDRHIVVHCHHGGRSMQVTQALRGQGYANVQNMEGGIDQWSEQVDPSVPRY